MKNKFRSSFCLVRHFDLGYRIRSISRVVKNSDERGNLFKHEKQISFECLPERHFDQGYRIMSITRTVKNSEEGRNLFKHGKQISSEFLPVRLFDLGYRVRSIIRTNEVICFSMNNKFRPSFCRSESKTWDIGSGR